ncbi:PREDICTED: docking protein 2 [Myotis davidii]|uniref:docking protein 2 n=1 Tax=Myotis davidii TaxID=225400 RepID=UPI0003EBD518|nr:PREDICTED: docking protein 2 [Myotis davidii]
MEDVAVKQGFLYLQQQQTFGKKWRRFGAVLYGQSGCALARLELQEGPEKPRRGEAARRVIRLSDCLRVAEASGEASGPRDTSTFFLETKERLYLLAAPTAERSNWMQAICLLAFPGQRKELPGPEGKGSGPCMEENELYSSTTTGASCKEFAVTMRPTEASERCRLRGTYTLRSSSPSTPAPTSRPRPEGEYAVPFDAVARNLGKSLRGILVVPPQPRADPLYDSIEEHPPSRSEHIYDEPEGVAVLSLYDSPQEPRGEAWRRQATADGDPSHPQHNYPVGQVFAASGLPRETEYDNVILKKGPK